MVEEALHLDIFRVNEEKANRYTAFCTFIAAVVAVLMWVLNLCGFFIVDQHLMNVAGRCGVVFAAVSACKDRERGYEAVKVCHDVLLYDWDSYFKFCADDSACACVVLSDDSFLSR